MLSLGRLCRQSTLLDRYCALLRRNRAAAPPQGLDPDLAVVAQAVERNNALPAAPATFRADLWSRIEAQGSASGAPRPWTGPVIDRNAGRRAQVRETEEQPIMTASTDQPLSLEKRRLSKELWKLAAAIAIFAIVGAVLVLLLRDNDNEPTVAAPVSTATTLASPAAEATATQGVDATQEAARAKLTATAVAQTATAGATATANASLPSSGEFVAEIPVGSSPFGIAATDGAIWVQSLDKGTIARIDPATNTVVATVQVGPEDGSSHAGLSDLAAFDGQVWTINKVDYTLVRIDPATNQVAQEIAVEPAAGSDDVDPFFMLVDETGIWVTEREGNRLLHIDPATGAVLASLDLPLPGWMAAGFGWAYNGVGYSDALPILGRRPGSARHRRRSVHRQCNTSRLDPQRWLFRSRLVSQPYHLGRTYRRMQLAFGQAHK
jgi:hypothetical protein